MREAGWISRSVLAGAVLDRIRYDPLPESIRAERIGSGLHLHMHDGRCVNHYYYDRYGVPRNSPAELL